MTLTPARRDYLRQIRGEHMEGVEVVTITRADLDALLEEAAKVEAVRVLHKPEKRWQPYEGFESSFATEDEALRSLDDLDVGVVVLENITEHGTPYFEICAECGRIDADQLDEFGEDWSYREGLWPCRTAKALGVSE